MVEVGDGELENGDGTRHGQEGQGVTALAERVQPASRSMGPVATAPMLTTLLP